MSALFPNVPDVPGVPVVNRAPARILSAISGSTDARRLAQDGLDFIGASNLVGAASAFGSSASFANAALGQIDPVFPRDALPTNSIWSAAGMAEGAVNALGRGDIQGAISAGQDAINYATDAIESLRDILNPTGEDILEGSGAEAQADIALQWGLYTQGGDLAAPCDTITAFESTLDSQISNFPVENGGFSSYNKVIMPFDIRLTMVRGGSVEDRQAFIKALQDAWQSVELFNVVTPEVVYLDVNVVGVRRAVESNRGVGMATLEVLLQKVRQTGRLAFTNTKEPSGAGSVNNGSVQTRPNFEYEGAVG